VGSSQNVNARGISLGGDAIVNQDKGKESNFDKHAQERRNTFLSLKQEDKDAFARGGREKVGKRAELNFLLSFKGRGGMGGKGNEEDHDWGGARRDRVPQTTGGKVGGNCTGQLSRKKQRRVLRAFCKQGQRIERLIQMGREERFREVSGA